MRSFLRPDSQMFDPDLLQLRIPILRREVSSRSMKVMETFTLHPALVADCHLLGNWEGIRLLLHKDAHVRWFILVPETSATEWHDVSEELQARILAAASALGAMLKAEAACDKINVAAIGNMVPQFHFHVIGRWKADPYWPGVVWGRSVPGCGYGEEDVHKLETETLSALSALKHERR